MLEFQLYLISRKNVHSYLKKKKIHNSNHIFMEQKNNSCDMEQSDFKIFGEHPLRRNQTYDLFEKYI